MALVKRARKRTRRPEKRTSKRVASKAGKLLTMADEGEFLWQSHESSVKGQVNVTDLVEAVAGTALSQTVKRKAARP